jgi:hypothetical protein
VYGIPNDTGVYLYLDKVGCLKRSVEFGISMRIQSAAKLLRRQFFGRARVAPYLCNVNMCTKDVLDSSKVWLVNAPEENYAHQKEINEYTREGE